MADLSPIDGRGPPPISRQTAVNNNLPDKAGRSRQEVDYGDLVVRASDEVDRSAWASLLAEMLAAAGMRPEQVAAPNGPVGTNWRTIYKWLRQEQGVSVAKVVQVCRELGYPPVDALVRVKFLTAGEVGLRGEPASPGPPLPRPLRQIADVLNAASVPAEVKDQLRRTVQAAFDMWAAVYAAAPPRERAGRERPETKR